MRGKRPTEQAALAEADVERSRGRALSFCFDALGDQSAVDRSDEVAQAGPFASRIGSGARLTRDQRRSLWLHGAVAGHLAADAVLQALTSHTPRAIELRQNSPFAGVLP